MIRSLLTVPPSAMAAGMLRFGPACLPMVAAVLVSALGAPGAMAQTALAALQAQTGAGAPPAQQTAQLSRAARTGSLPWVVAEALHANGLPPEAVSMLVLPVDSGPARLDHLGMTVRQPASVMKLFTTGAALLALGPAFSWRTDAALGGPLMPDGRLLGPLYLRGSGDPSLVVENVWLMMSRWRAAGLRDIQGGIVVDRGMFELPPHDSAAFDGAALKPYNAGPDALLLNHQAVTLRLMPDAARPGGVSVSMEPELDGVRLDNHVSLLRQAPCGAWREGLKLAIEPTPVAQDAPESGGRDQQAAPSTGWTVRVSGPYPQACEQREWPLLWQGDGAGDHAARLLRRTWGQLGGALGGQIDREVAQMTGRTVSARPVGRMGGGADAAQPDARAEPLTRGTWPDGLPVWQSWPSPPLAKIVQDINKFSNNVMARQLFLSLAPPPAPATLEKAREAVGTQIRGATRDASGLSACDGNALVLDNGSGLSRQERSSAWCLGRWLQAMWASPVMPEFLASLPVTGVDGTARRLDSTSGRAHIKTGSLEGVSAIAGVVLGESGQRYIVVGIVNHPRASNARPALDALLAWAMRDGGVVPPP
jgi:D-alanyl-D-alanine carboxypeptidase/D-alanyl-D-alanine-endopeptidase (penicillin-binding protein 4)